MITLAILLIALFIIGVLAAIWGLGTFVAYGDIIICGLILFWIIKSIIKRRKK